MSDTARHDRPQLRGAVIGLALPRAHRLDAASGSAGFSLDALQVKNLRAHPITRDTPAESVEITNGETLLSLWRKSAAVVLHGPQSNRRS
jgi:hypothetical protein